MKRIIIWITAGIILIVSIIVAMAILGIEVKMLKNLFISEAKAEDGICWVLCEKNSYVNVREKPRRNSEIVATAYCGLKVKTDGKTRSGYIHLIDMAAEETTGWINAAYIVDEEPQVIDCALRIRAQGRVACRKMPGGKVIGWVHDGDVVTVYCVAGGWAVTDRGYIRTEFIEPVKG